MQASYANFPTDENLKPRRKSTMPSNPETSNPQNKSPSAGPLEVLIRHSGKNLFDESRLDTAVKQVLDAAVDLHADGASFAFPVTSGQGVKWIFFHDSRTAKNVSGKEPLKIAAKRALEQAARLKCNSIDFHLEMASAPETLAVEEGALLGSYRYEKYKSKSEASAPFNLLTGSQQAGPDQANLHLLCDSINQIRDLVNETSSNLTPARLADWAVNMAKECGLKCRILDENELEQENCNGVLTVGQGSDNPPRMIILEYIPEKQATSSHLGLVGKAVTFDTGGHSLKKPDAMWEMKSDMAGGAAVLGAMAAIGRLKPEVRVTAFVPSVVNAIGPKAVLPGDIIRSRSGKTVHVDNTDAEGRLILMDALDMIQTTAKPTHIVDAATLTGSIVRALGTAITGFFCTDNPLADAIIACGDQVGEPFWQMPLLGDYREQLDHPVADIDNVGKDANGGAIKAALFLKEFVKPDVKWAHMDIAGTALLTKPWRYYDAGATGVGVKTMVCLAKKLASAQLG